MASIIEKSVQEYMDYLDGKPVNVRVDKVKISTRTESNKPS